MKFALIAVGAVVLVVAVAAAGRVESDRGVRAQNQGIRTLWELNAFDREHGVYSAYRVSRTFACLLQPVGTDPYAMEFCFDSNGRVVEAIDRTGLHPVFWTLTYDPGASTTRLDPKRLAAIFRRLGADASVGYTGSGLPIGYEDTGPTVVPFRLPGFSVRALP